MKILICCIWPWCEANETEIIVKICMWQLYSLFSICRDRRGTICRDDFWDANNKKI